METTGKPFPMKKRRGNRGGRRKRRKDKKELIPPIVNKIRSNEDPTKYGIFNLSSHVLTKEEVKVLEKGLKFAPTNQLDLFNVYVDVEKFVRKLTIKKFFENKKNVESSENNINEKKVFKNKSSFYPKHTRGCFIESNSPQQGNKYKRCFNNLTKGERKALKDLQSCEGLVIKPADKGGGSSL